ARCPRPPRNPTRLTGEAGALLTERCPRTDRNLDDRSTCTIVQLLSERERGVVVQKTGAGIREWAGLALLALPTVLLGLDVTVLYLVLPSIAADLNPSGTQTLWIMDAD